MGRYLLIEFDSDEEADAFDRNLEAEAPSSIRAIAMYSKPSSLCDCTEKHDQARGTTFGWYVCRGCLKPRAGSPQTLANMFDDNKTPSKFRELFLLTRWDKNEDGTVKTRTSLPRELWP